MAIEFSIKKNTQNPTATAGLTAGEPAFNTVLNTLFIGKGYGITAAWVGAPISNDYLQVAAGLTQQIPTLGAVKDYVNSFVQIFGTSGQSPDNATVYSAGTILINKIDNKVWIGTGNTGGTSFALVT